MAQKFTGLDEAAKQLGVSKDRLTQLREVGKVRGYRDGQSWKFRSEDIDKFASEGLPSLDAEPSGLDLDDELSLGDDVDLVDDDALPSPDSPEPSGVDMELAGDDEDELALASPASDISLADVDEPTVAGDEGSDDALAIDLGDDEISMSDSILLSEAELGGAPPRPPSTIIGKNELDLDADLDLSPADTAKRGPASDVKLAPPSDILPLEEDTGLELPSPSGDFEGLEELEIDLEAESSRIMSPEDVAKVKSAAAAAQQAEESDLQLAPTDSTTGSGVSEIGLGSGAGSELDLNLSGLSALELEDDDDQVLGEGSDVTLSGESSGINIISPSDSGLALDEVSLDLSGSSPIGSSLDLGGSLAEEVSLEPLMVGEGMESKIGEDFQLTPLGEDTGDDEEKDSSQVIALEEISEEGLGAPAGFGSAPESGMFTEDVGLGLGPGAAPVSVSTVQDTPFSGWNVAGLGTCLVLLLFCGMMTFDILRNIWSWDGVSSLNSPLLDAFARMFRLI